ncbi:MAG: molybdate ABC transporter substrate-binding protein [Immundisolibacter sp.]
MISRLLQRLALCLLLGPATSASVGAAEATAAVAANFAAAMERLESAFEQASGHRLTVVFGSSGKLAAQVQQGAPFDVFLSADVERPVALQAAGFALPDSRFTYAIGRLALWSPDPQAFNDGAAYLATGRFRHLAIANPALAPYGKAAQQALQALGVWAAVQDRIVRAGNIGQTYAMVAGGATQAGFVALAQLTDDTPGSRWPVPQELHAPIRQDAVLLLHGRDNPAARAFLDYLRSPPARAVITAQGYDLP